MKIDKVEAIAIEVPLPKPFAGATYTVPTRNTIITRIYTDDGLVSEVFNGDNRKCGPEVARIVNEDMVNVSLSCEFQTVKSLVRANAAYANGVLRRNFGMSPQIAKDSAPALYGKAFLARIFKILKVRKAFAYQVPRTFEVDLGSEHAVRDIQPMT